MSLAAAHGNPAVPVLMVLFSVAGFAGYWVPSIVAVARRVPNVGSVIVIDLLLGWTVVGWVVAMAMACRSRPRPVPYGQWPPQT